MNDAELAKRLDVLRAKGVVTFSESTDGCSYSVTLGPLPGEAPVAAAKEKSEPEWTHPADLVAQPPALSQQLEGSDA